MHKTKEMSGNNRIISCIIGPEGEYFPEMGGLENVFCRGLFWSYYNGRKIIKSDTIQKYIRGTAPFPRKVKQFYTGKDGEMHIRQNVERLVNACMCTGRLRIIQENVAAFIAYDAVVDESTVNLISNCYVGNGANREQIIAYLTCVMSCIMHTM